MGRANRVAELDPASGKVLRWFPTGKRTWGIGLSPDETRLYAASGLSGTVTIIDLTRGKVIAHGHSRRPAVGRSRGAAMKSGALRRRRLAARLVQT